VQDAQGEMSNMREELKNLDANVGVKQIYHFGEAGTITTTSAA
jgi:hypothetical protein